MLPAGSRLRRRADFTDTVRAARRVRGGRLLVVHTRAASTESTGSSASTGGSAADSTDSTSPARAVRVGFVVSRAVGSAVVRNRVKRRLRHLVAARLDQLAPGTDVVVRALPESATATGQQLAAALDQALRHSR